MATELHYRGEGGNFRVADEANGLPVRLPGGSVRALNTDYLWKLAANGKVFIASDADQNDTVTGQTSFASTTPTLLLDVPADTVVVPLFVNLSQAGTVAGDIVNVVMEMDNKKRYASGGTAEKSFNARTGSGEVSKATVYSGATASAGYGIRLWGAQIGQDVSPAEGAVQGPFWRPEIPYMLYGASSLLIYTYATTTGPTFLWTMGWVELTVAEANAIGAL